ncbi:hypothetical protein CFB46_20695 [Burkholderia sp. HI2761]|uniref:hypothetical protein n=1 Tax=unclassified Burkholderia TaxID=2613784 RepID=UPI000B7A23CE|nr:MULTISPECIES: hypothetical protein [unclassified Burkholderia]MPV59461.1 hypothetical protein [Burkholderia sp. BE24]OXJ23319.1 hypothetical protein CFB46_20695 [Burkholderia sp. HI2761]
MRQRRPISDWHSFSWRATIVTLCVVIGMLAALGVAVWLATCTLYVSLHLNPLRAHWSAWVDALLAWSDGGLPNMGRRLAGAGFIGLAIAFGGSALAVYAWVERAARRALYGDARFATDADIRKAGL